MGPITLVLLVLVAAAAVLNLIRLQRARREGGSTTQPVVRLVLALVIAVGISLVALA
jgi:hypothetical protein